MSSLLHLTYWYPFERGRNFLYRTFFVRPVFQERLARLANPIETRRRFLLYANKHDSASNYIRVWGECEPATESFLLSALEGGGTFIDIGANVGYFSLLIAHQFGDRCHVIAFEPNPSIFSLLAAGVRVSRHPERIQPVQAAVSDKPGRVSFCVDETNSGHSRITLSPQRQATFLVEAVRLDDWLESTRLPRPIRAIKLDVEGCELRALEGMERTLLEDRPLLVVEVIGEHLRDFGDSEERLISYLEGLGYSCLPKRKFDLNRYFVPRKNLR